MKSDRYRSSGAPGCNPCSRFFGARKLVDSYWRPEGRQARYSPPGSETADLIRPRIAGGYRGIEALLG